MEGGISPTSRVSPRSDRKPRPFEGNDPGGWSYYPDISGDGHTVMFQSSATRLIPGLERVTKPQAFVAVWS